MRKLFEVRFAVARVLAIAAASWFLAPGPTASSATAPRQAAGPGQAAAPTAPAALIQASRLLNVPKSAVERILGKPEEEDEYASSYRPKSLANVAVTYENGKSVIVSVFFREPVADWTTALRLAGIDPAGVKATTSDRWTPNGHPTRVLTGIRGLPPKWHAHFTTAYEHRFEGEVDKVDASLTFFLEGLVVPFEDE